MKIKIAIRHLWGNLGHHAERSGGAQTGCFDGKIGQESFLRMLIFFFLQAASWEDKKENAADAHF